MSNFRETIRSIATISPSSIGVLLIIGGWEPIYQLLLLFKAVDSTFSGFFITVGIILSLLIFIFDYIKYKARSKNVKKR